MKRCRKCDEAKPLEAFVKDKRSKDGRTARCSECWNADQRRRYHERAYVENKRRYREANQERIRKGNRERTRRWRAANPERARQKATESSRRLRARDPEYHRRWYEANIEKERARARRVMREFRERYPERAKAIRERYRTRHPDLIRERERENTQRRRALMKDSSPEVAAYMTAMLKEPCAYCDATDNITVDHVVPLSRGGKHEIANLAPACVTCNCSKGAKTLEEWFDSLKQSLE